MDPRLRFEFLYRMVWGSSSGERWLFDYLESDPFPDAEGLVDWQGKRWTPTEILAEQWLRVPDLVRDFETVLSLIRSRPQDLELNTVARLWAALLRPVENTNEERAFRWASALIETLQEALRGFGDTERNHTLDLVARHTMEAFQGDCTGPEAERARRLWKTQAWGWLNKSGEHLPDGGRSGPMPGMVCSMIEILTLGVPKHGATAHDTFLAVGGDSSNREREALSGAAWQQALMRTAHFLIGTEARALIEPPRAVASQSDASLEWAFRQTVALSLVLAALQAFGRDRCDENHQKPVDQKLLLALCENLSEIGRHLPFLERQKNLQAWNELQERAHQMAAGFRAFSLSEEIVLAGRTQRRNRL